MPDQYERERGVAVEAVREAAMLCREVQAAITAETLEKKDRSPVTVADFGSQALILSVLERNFPHDPVMAEEDSAELRSPEHRSVLDRVIHQVRNRRPDCTADQVCRWIDRGGVQAFTDRFWTLDPIDGTKGFLRNGQYAISLALLVNGQLEVAALASPNLPAVAERPQRSGAIFSAGRGGGSWVEPLDVQQTRSRVRVSECSDPATARFCESVEAGHSSHGDAAAIASQLGIVADPLRMDSQAKYAVVARGEADIYLRLPTRADYREKVWDHAGGVLVVTEAGGLVTDITGRPLDFTHGRELVNNRGVVVTNGHLHARVLAAVQSVRTTT